MKKISFKDLKELSLFSDLTEENLNKILKISQIQDLKKGEMLFWDKEQINYVYIILKGKVSIFKISEVANKRIFFILSEGEIVNEIIVDDNLSEASSCEIFEYATLLKIKKEDFIKLMMENFDFNKKVISTLTKKIRRLYRQLKNTSMIKIEKRVAAKLYRLAIDYGKEDKYGILIELNISITYLADMLGVTRETVSRAVKKLQDLEMIRLIKRRIYILDIEKLVCFFKN